LDLLGGLGSCCGLDGFFGAWADSDAAHLLVDLLARRIRVVDEQVDESFVDLLLQTPLQLLDHQGLVRALFLQLFAAALQHSQALFGAVLLVASEVRATLLARQFRKARLVLVVLDLVAADGDLVADVARDGLVGAVCLPVVLQKRLVDDFSTLVGTLDKSVGAVALDVLLQLVESDVRALALVRAAECSLIDHAPHQEVQVGKLSTAAGALCVVAHAAVGAYETLTRLAFFRV